MGAPEDGGRVMGAPEDGGRTLGDVHGERASGDLLPGEGDVDGVRSLQLRDVAAAQDTVPFVLQHNLHGVPPATRVHDDDAHVSGP